MRYQTRCMVAAMLMIAAPSVVFAQPQSTPPTAAAAAPADIIRTPTGGAGTMHDHDGMMKDGQAMGSGMRKEGQSMGKDGMGMGKGMGMSKEGMMNKGDKGG